MNESKYESEQQTISTQKLGIVIGSAFLLMCIGSLWIPGTAAFPLWGNILGSVLFGALGIWWVRLNIRIPHLLDWLRDEEKFEAFQCAFVRWTSPLLVAFADAIFWAATQPAPHSHAIPLPARIAVIAVFSLVFLVWWALLLIFPQLEEKSLPDEVVIAGLCFTPTLNAWLLCSPQWATICTILAAGCAVCIAILLRRRRARREESLTPASVYPGWNGGVLVVFAWADDGRGCTWPDTRDYCCALPTRMGAICSPTRFDERRSPLAGLGMATYLLATLCGYLLDLVLFLCAVCAGALSLVTDLLVQAICWLCASLSLMATSVIERALDSLLSFADETVWEELAACAIGLYIVQAGSTLPVYQVLILLLVLLQLATTWD